MRRGYTPPPMSYHFVEGRAETGASVRNFYDVDTPQAIQGEGINVDDTDYWFVRAHPVSSKIEKLLRKIDEKDAEATITMRASFFRKLLQQAMQEGGDIADAYWKQSPMAYYFRHLEDRRLEDETSDDSIAPDLDGYDEATKIKMCAEDVKMIILGLFIQGELMEEREIFGCVERN